MTEAFSVNDMSDDDPRAMTVAAMVTDLGYCLCSYGRVEYLIGDLVWHGRSMEEYANAAEGQFPISMAARIRCLTAMLAVEGPFSPWAEDLHLLMVRLEQLEEPRHLFVHGHTSFYYTPAGDAGMMFRTFLAPARGGGRPAEKYEGLVRPASLAEAKFAWTVFAATAQNVARDIYLTLELVEP